MILNQQTNDVSLSTCPISVCSFSVTLHRTIHTMKRVAGAYHHTRAQMVLHRSKWFCIAGGVGTLFIWRLIHTEMQISHSSVLPQSRVHSGGTTRRWPSLLEDSAQGCEQDTRCTCNGTLVYGRKFVNGDTRATAAEAMEMGYLHKGVSGENQCSNEEMGGNPAFGIAKFCYCLAGMDVVRCICMDVVRCICIGYCCAVT